MTWCKHYRAMAYHMTCEADIAYRSVQLIERGRPDMNIDYPCFNPNLHNCPFQDWPTPEELKAEEEAVNQMVAQFLTDLASNVCPHCKQPIERKVQIGRCVYAEPCNHRLYQGEL